MVESDVVNTLMYDKDTYQIYKDFQNSFLENEYLSFEVFLLLQDNLEMYIKSPDTIIKKYSDYHRDKKVEDFESFELFCKSFQVFPYDEEKLDEYRKCGNCRYCAEATNIIDNDNVLICNGDEETSYDSICDFHAFDYSKAKSLVRKLRQMS